jgi:unsaturated rhamnogalacturonyl hydrolase
MKTYSVVVLCLMIGMLAALPVYSQEGNGGWEKAGQILVRIKVPDFPDRDFVITDYGAKEGGTKDCTAAIRKAIDACSKKGGGRVLVPEGTFLTGAIHLKSNVNLHLLKGATLLFKTDPKAYLPVVFARWEGIECMNYSPFIYAFGQKNIAVTGDGVLDGGASDSTWWAWKRKGANGQSPSAADAKLQNELADKGVPPEQRILGEGHFLRPNFFEPYRCQNVLIEGVTFHRSPMWEVNPVLCTNVIVRNVKIETHGPNNDGCDPESCRDVLIENCVFDAGDDCIAIKSGRNDDGRRVNVPSENLIIRGCTMKDGHAGVAIGSEISGGCRNVFIENCKMDSPNLDRALRLKSNARRGGVIDSIYMRNVEIGQVSEALLTVDFLYEEGAQGSHPPVVRDIFIDRITSHASPRVFYMTGFEGATIDNIHLSNSTFSGVHASEVMEHVGNVLLDHVTIEHDKNVRSKSSRQLPE